MCVSVCMCVLGVFVCMCVCLYMCVWLCVYMCMCVDMSSTMDLPLTWSCPFLREDWGAITFSVGPSTALTSAAPSAARTPTHLRKDGPGSSWPPACLASPLGSGSILAHLCQPLSRPGAPCQRPEHTRSFHRYHHTGWFGSF